MKKFMFLVLTFLFTGCAVQHIQVVDPTGQQIPTPNYTLSSGGIQTVFYYVGLIPIKDLDGSTVYKKVYLDQKKPKIDPQVKNISLEMLVLNPNRVKYKILRKEDNKVKLVGKSNLDFREFKFDIPDETKFGIILTNISRDPLMYIGDFYYSSSQERRVENLK